MGKERIVAAAPRVGHTRGFSLVELVVVVGIIAVIATVAVTLMLLRATRSGQPEVFPASNLSWGPALPGWPADSQGMVLSGRAGVGAQTVRVRLPAGARFGPHWHIKAVSLTVLSGRLILGFGEDPETGRTESLESGSFLTVPRRAPYFGRTIDETVLQICSETTVQTMEASR